MQFISIHFGLFLVVVFMAYWLVKKPSIQNGILLISSYYFFSFWDYRFLFLLIFSTFLDFYLGGKIQNSQSISIRKRWLTISIVINLGFLCTFKYFNFFVTSFIQLLHKIGIEVDTWTLNIILPIGISFYTFHGLSYVIDIYHKRIDCDKNWINYSLFVSFFPLLVAGPIERATHLLPQIRGKRIFSYENGVDGVRQILWGMFKKIVISDYCAIYVNDIFSNTADLSGSSSLMGAFLFSIQIYCDFSGYSDIATGTARLFGFDLLQNFSFPYFSRSISEFWKRWHISLSSWFKDYLYIPLGGNKLGKRKTIRNIFIVFLLSGLWHGANWTFIAWGLLHAIYFIPTIYRKNRVIETNVVAFGKIVPSMKEFFQMTITYSLTMIAWIFFRSATLSEALNYVKNLFTNELFTSTRFLDIQLMMLIFGFILIEWMGREQKYAIQTLVNRIPKVLRWILYLVLAYSIFMFSGKKEEFIYFQF